jgi:hypothetical protein
MIFEKASPLAAAAEVAGVYPTALPSGKAVN